MTNRYRNGIIYRLVCNKTNNQYIGSTCMPLRKRLYFHKFQFKKWLEGKNSYLSSFEIIKNEDFDIVLIEEVSCENKQQLLQRERHHIESNTCVNKSIPTRTPQEYVEQNREQRIMTYKKYRETHREQISSYNKSYKEQHKEEVSIYNKNYRENHIEKFRAKETEVVVCECGSQVIKSTLSRHKKTNKHKNLIS